MLLNVKSKFQETEIGDNRKQESRHNRIQKLLQLNNELKLSSKKKNTYEELNNSNIPDDHYVYDIQREWRKRTRNIK